MIIKTIFVIRVKFKSSIINEIDYSLESAGDGGELLMVSGLIQSEGDGDLSRFVTVPKPRDKPCPFPLAVPLPMPAEWPRWLLGKPSTGIPFSDRNSSKSAYWGRKGGINDI